MDRQDLASNLVAYCGPESEWPAAYWGPERLDPVAWRELTPLIDAREEIGALVAAMRGVGSIADVGGGTGLLTREVAARVAPVVVIEPSAAQRAGLPAPDDDARITSVAGRAERVPLADGAVDAAMATWVLQYTDDPAAAVRELARIARTRVVIVQAAPPPRNDLVAVYTVEAAVAGLPRAHHGWLLARAAATLEAAGWTVELRAVASTVAAPDGGAAELADVLARLHFAGHERIAEMRAATKPMILERLRTNVGVLRDDAVMLVGRR